MDDLLATGGTAKTTVDFIRNSAAQVLEFAVIVELISLPGRGEVDIYIFSPLEI